MDLLDTPSPSVQSLLDSDLESVESLQYLDIEELDEVEYALPSSVNSNPSLAEVLLDDDKKNAVKHQLENNVEPMCSALQADFLHGISKQLQQAQERSSAGASTSLSVGTEGKLTVGTANGHILTFQDQTLRWVCDSNSDKGAVSCLSYNQDSTRLLAGYATGLVVQYETSRGIILRRINLGGEIWGTLQVTWAGTSALALDTGGSVWLIKFSRPLGVRSARTSCLFSGARGEVVAMAARDARILALATLTRVIIVAGGRAAGLRLAGPPDTLPVMVWCETNERILVCARDKILQWLSVTVNGSSISLRPVQRAELKTSPLWLGWLGGNLAIFDADENLRLWGDDFDKPLDLCHIEPVYACAFFKGVWTDGKVSRAMCKAGASALGGACVRGGALAVLGRRGVVRARPRDVLTRAQSLINAQNYLQALRLLTSTKEDAKALVSEFITNISDTPSILDNKRVSDQVIKLIVKYNLSDELWTILWEQCAHIKEFVEALGDAIVRGELHSMPPSPDNTQALIEKLAEFEPSLVERVIASLPLTSLDPHRASVFTRENRLWGGVGAVAAALGGSGSALRELVRHVGAGAGCGGGGECGCACGALVVAAADALAGRALPPHARPSAQHDALHTLVSEEAGCEGRSPLQVMCAHDARACVRLLEQCTRDPPFAGPLGKQNRLRVTRSLLHLTPSLQANEDRVEILDFVASQLTSGALPADRELIKAAEEVAAGTEGERADRAWVCVATRARPPGPSPVPEHRPRVLWRLLAAQHPPRAHHALQLFMQIDNPSNIDLDELFEFLRDSLQSDPDARRTIETHIHPLIDFRPRATAALVDDRLLESIEGILLSTPTKELIEFGEHLLEMNRLRGDAARAHLRNLCSLRPDEVKTFLTKHAGVVRPEDALAVVRETGPAEAEPMCLEAVGDPSGALESILKLLPNADEYKKANLIREACALCTRVAPTVPAHTITDLWTKLLRHANETPPSLLMEAVAYLPAAELIEKTQGDGRVAFKLLEYSAVQSQIWSCAGRILKREVHEALARRLRSARRGASARGACIACGGALASGAGARTAHCGCVLHAPCPPPAPALAPPLACPVCGHRLSDIVVSLSPHSCSPVSVLPAEYPLSIVAPPRPDFEGIA